MSWGYVGVMVVIAVLALVGIWINIGFTRDARHANRRAIDLTNVFRRRKS